MIILQFYQDFVDTLGWIWHLLDRWRGPLGENEEIKVRIYLKDVVRETNQPHDV